MNKYLTKYSIIVPSNVSILYYPKKQLLTLIGPLNKKSLKLGLKLEILKEKKIIYVTSNTFLNFSKIMKKNIKSLRGTTVSHIKQLILETSTILYTKLKLVGVGYKIFNTEKLQNKLLLFKLGFSHPIYFKIPDKLNIFCLKQTKLFIYGTSYQNVSQTASIIQSSKYPEPYKGKGILYENEKIKLKEGKKT
jgi:large subunit ribosomal protein L6